MRNLVSCRILMETKSTGYFNSDQYAHARYGLLMEFIDKDKVEVWENFFTRILG